MDRNLFRRTAIDWDDWLADGPAQALQPAGPAPIDPQQSARARSYELPVRQRPVATVQQLPAQPLAGLVPHQQPMAQPPVQPAPRQAAPHSWREAMSAVQAPAPLPQVQAQPAPHVLTQQPPAPTRHSGIQAPQMQQKPAAVVVSSPQVQPQQPAATQRQWKTPPQPAVKQPPQQHQVAQAPQPATDPQSQHNRMQSVLANARSAVQDAPNNDNGYRHGSTPHKRPRSRLWRSVAWFGAMAGVFAISFGATIAPAYLHGKLNQSATADSATQSSVQNQPADGQSTATQAVGVATAGTLSVAGSGTTLQGTTTQTSGGLPEGYKQTKAMYKTVGMTIQRQNLPTSYGGNPANVKAAADNLQLQTTPVQTDRWKTAYIADSNGVQLALLADSRYLVVIQAQGHLNAAEWKDFLESYDGS